MVHQTEQRIEEKSRQESLANPPPAAARVEAPLFQTMDELQVRHGNSPLPRERMYLWGGGLVVGLILFGILCALIIFVE